MMKKREVINEISPPPFPPSNFFTIGCGKTTLISALSNRMSLGSSLKGDTYINGYLNEVGQQE